MYVVHSQNVLTSQISISVFEFFLSIQVTSESIKGSVYFCLPVYVAVGPSCSAKPCTMNIYSAHLLQYSFIPAQWLHARQTSNILTLSVVWRKAYKVTGKQNLVYYIQTFQPHSFILVMLTDNSNHGAPRKRELVRSICCK